MNRTVFAALSVALAAISTHAAAAIGATIYESGTLGPTGVGYGDTEGTNINPFVYAGVRFELTQPVVTSQVGGHFVSQFGGGTFFGALVKLAGPNDVPDSGDLSTPDVLGKASLMFPSPSAEVFGDLEIPLAPGWYALVFGSGLFGTNGRGASVRNAPDFGSPGFVGFQPNSGFGWYDYAVPTANGRFVVLGSVVPESSTAHLVLMGLGTAVLFVCYRSNTFRSFASGHGEVEALGASPAISRTGLRQARSTPRDAISSRRNWQLIDPQSKKVGGAPTLRGNYSRQQDLRNRGMTWRKSLIDLRRDGVGK